MSRGQFSTFLHCLVSAECMFIGNSLSEQGTSVPFHTVHVVLKARMLTWFAIPFSWTMFCQSSPPWPSRPQWPSMAWLSFIEWDKAVVHVISLLSFLWLWFSFLSALWWMRIRGLWKFPDRKDWLWVELGLALVGKAMLNKSLIQFSADGWGCVPSLEFGLRSNHGRSKGNLLQKDLCQHVSPPRTAADYLTCLKKPVCRSRSKPTWTADRFQIGKGVHQGCILSLCLFNVYAEYIMQNARLDEAQAGIKIAGRNINNLIYADDTTLMAESEEELKSLLVRVKEGSEKAGLNSQHLVPPLHGK